MTDLLNKLDKETLIDIIHTQEKVIAEKPKVEEGELKKFTLRDAFGNEINNKEIGRIESTIIDLYICKKGGMHSLDDRTPAVIKGAGIKQAWCSKCGMKIVYGLDD